MSYLIKDNFHQSLADAVFYDLLTRRSNYYYFTAKTSSWQNEIVPESPENNLDYEYETRNNIIGLRRINANDISFVVPRINWVSGTIYDYFDGNYSELNPSDTGATSLKTAQFYVLTSSFNVYKCLFNNNGQASTIEPSGYDPIPIATADNYVWKYLYTIPLSLRNKFLTDEYIPVQRGDTNSYFSNGQISSVTIDSPGSGYTGNSNVLLTVNGTFINASSSFNSVANLVPVFNNTGSIVKVLIQDTGNNYKSANITITDIAGSGRSLYKNLSNVLTLHPGAGYYSANLINNTFANVVTTGTVLPTSNVQLIPSFNNNSLVNITIINSGSGYTSAVIANTTLSISTYGVFQPTTNATAKLHFANSAIFTPIIVNGRISDVIINDPGINYSSNLQTYISITGDGAGASLVPFINNQGQLTDVVIENRGSGYTFATFNIVGAGTGANISAGLSTGDTNTLQDIVELSAVDGGIHSFNVLESGNGYSYANIVVNGDGSGFIGTPIILNNTISYITITNPGSKYSYANVSIIGDGANANVQAIISPFGGHGFNAVKELFADTLMITSTSVNEKLHGIKLTNDYRQFGILRNPTKFNSKQYFTDIAGVACYLLTMDTIGSLTVDKVLSLSTDYDKKFEILEIVTATNQILVLNKNNYEIEAGEILKDLTTNINYSVNDVSKLPTINKQSGELLYIDNRPSVTINEQQAVVFRTIIKL